MFRAKRRNCEKHQDCEDCGGWDCRDCGNQDCKDCRGREISVGKDREISVGVADYLAYVRKFLAQRSLRRLVGAAGSLDYARKFVRSGFFAAGVVLSILFLALIFGENSYAYASGITLTIPAEPLSLNLTPSSESTFAKSSVAQVSVMTDNSTGYTLSIKSGSEDDADVGAKLKNSLNNSFITSISEATSEDSFKSDTKFNNSWGYLPSKFNSSLNTDFLPAPTTNSSTIEKTESANGDAANSYDFTVAAKIDQSVSSGDYQNTFVFSATVNEVPAEPMQNWLGCESLSEHETVRLRDTRDDTIYTVSKLKDGKCWMVENLKLGGDETIELTPENSDVSANFTLPASSTSGFVYNTFDIANVYVHSTYGGYYTWYAATAGTGTGSMSSGNASSSICPKGWRLPTGGSGGEFQTLYNSYNSSAAMRATPVPGFVLSGYYDSSSAYGQGSNGNYWSSSVRDSGNAYYLRLDSSSVAPTGYHWKGRGYSVRCVAEEKTMQTVSEWGDQVKEHQVVTAIDTRDNTTYKVSRLKDGKLWMVENLRIADKTITSADSDVEDTFTIPTATDASTFKTDASNVENNKTYVDSYGGMYTWYTATAGTGSASTTTHDQNVSGSICPKGWRLPTSGSDISVSDFCKLVTVYGGNDSTGSTNLRATPVPGFSYTGYILYSIGSLYDQGSRGFYWSSTIQNSTGAYGLHLVSSGWDCANYDYRVDGRPMRCMANKYEYSITYNLNSGTGGPEQNPQTGETWDSTVKLSDATPSREDYVFKGWCDQETTDETCSGTTYQTGADYPLVKGSNTVTLWAVWEKVCPNAVTACSSGGYDGMRFGDGKCWMSTDFKSIVNWSSDFSCPSGWSTPTHSDFYSLISSSQAGSGACLYEQGWSGRYWSSTQYSSGSYYALLVNSTSARNSNSGIHSDSNVRCVSS